MTQRCERQQRFRGVLIGLLTVGALLAAAGGVDAQIYEWADDANHRHYANSLDLVPTAARTTARLVVREATPPADAAVSTSNGDEDDRRQDQPPEDPFASSWDMGFRAGWEAGYRTGVAEQPVCPAQPPVIVLESNPPMIVDVPRYDPYGLYYRSPYQGTLTVAFDGGRSRGLTLRQLVEGVTP
jgi:hypothetical protein